MTNTAGQRAIAEAERLFGLDVSDPPKSDRSASANASRAVINSILRSAGWGFATPYLGNGPPQWCGLFAAACWRKAGIDPAWLATYWASCYRLVTWAKYQRFDPKHPNPRPVTGPQRLLAILDEHSTSMPFDPLPGDVVIVGDGEPDTGDHITLAVSFDAATLTFQTLSGNGGGVGPRGNKREGISRRDYKIGGPGYCVRFVVRPSPLDMLAELPA